MRRSVRVRVLLASAAAMLIVAMAVLIAALTTGPAAIDGHAHPATADSPFGGGSSGGGGASGGW